VGHPNWLIIENNSEDPDLLNSRLVNAKRRVKYILKNSGEHARGILFVVSLLIIIPITTHAFTSFLNKIFSWKPITVYSSQTLPLLFAHMPMDIKNAQGGGDITIVDGLALVAEIGPLGTEADVEKLSKNAISLYVVREGDTLGSIAKLFDVSVATIRGFNNIRTDKDLRVGQELLILPIDGLSHTVKKGETLSSIAKKYKGDEFDIALFNGLEGEKLVVGTELIIPNAEYPKEESTKTKTKSSPSKISSSSGGKSYPAGFYINPLPGAITTQGSHGTYDARDYSTRQIGSPVVASSSGTVIAVRLGWSGGYGNMIIIDDGVAQVLYAHLQNVYVSVGEKVSQGKTIGTMGNTGKSTGPHLHIEYRGKNGPIRTPILGRDF